MGLPCLRYKYLERAKVQFEARKFIIKLFRPFEDNPFPLQRFKLATKRVDLR